MENLKLFIIMILSIAFLWGCNDDNKVVPQSFSINENNAGSFTTPGGSAVIEISAAGAMVSSSENWCKAVVNNTKITVTVEPNLSLESRHAVLTIQLNGTTVALPVSQSGNKLPHASVEKVSFNARGGVDSVTITSILAVTVSTEAEWLTTTMNEDTLVITAIPYLIQGEPRTAWVIYSSGELKDSLLIEQTGISFTVDKNQIEFVGMKGYSETMDIESTFEVAVESKPDWVTLTIDGSKLTIQVTDSDENKLREGDVELVMEGIHQTVHVIQRPVIYSDFLGQWTLSGLSSTDRTTITYNLTISAEVEGESYSVLGWSGSGIDGDGFPFIMNFDEEKGEIYIQGLQNLGKYGTYQIRFVGLASIGANYTIITGNYKAMIGEFAENKVSWFGQDVTLSDGTYTFAGMAYRAYTGTGYGAFEGDGPFPINPVMTKVKTSVAKANYVMKNTSLSLSDKSETVRALE